MRRPVRWSSNALADFAHRMTYLASENPAAARVGRSGKRRSWSVAWSTTCPPNHDSPQPWRSISLTERTERRLGRRVRIQGFVVGVSEKG